MLLTLTLTITPHASLLPKPSPSSSPSQVVLEVDQPPDMLSETSVGRETLIQREGSSLDDEGDVEPVWALCDSFHSKVPYQKPSNSDL